MRLVIEAEETVRELNRLYPESFGRDLRIVPSAGIELRCGPNPVFEGP